jgi:hypothetical protein
MRRELPEPERLRDRAASDAAPRAAEERAGELLQMIGEPVLPSREQLLAVKPRFAATDLSAPWGRAWQAATAVALVLGTAGVVAAARGGWLGARRPVVVEVPPGSTSHITAPSGGKAHVVGPSSVETTGPGFVLRHGNMIAEAGREPLGVSVGGLAVTVAPGGSARMIIEAESARVENLAGEVLVGDGSGRQAVPAGQSWYNGLVTASLGDRSTSLGNVISNEMPAPSPQSSELPEGLFGTDPWGAGAASALPVDPAKLGPPERPGDHAESHLLGLALRKLRKEGDARGALELFDQHDKRFPAGRLGPEARFGRVEALMALGRRSEALAILDAAPLSDLRRPIRVLRGELRAGLGRCAEASSDFAASLSSDPHDTIDDRALFGRAFCRAELGDKAGAKVDLSLYASRFPSGQFIVQVKRSLSGK